MRLKEITAIPKLIFTPEDVKDALGVSFASAKVTCSRYASSGILLRLKRNYYTLPQNWKRLSEDEAFKVANMLEIPSYISLTTALGFYNMTTQVQRDFYESISMKRTKERVIDGRMFMFTKIDRALYGGFVKADGVFIAEPEKAALDAVYLASLKRYSFDFDAVDFSKMNKARIREMIKKYPDGARKLWREHVGPV